MTPDTTTSNSINFGNGITAYVRSANVTTLLQQGGAGTYIAGNIVGTIAIPGDSTGNHAGWTLGVIYQNASLPFRNMSIRAGAVLVQAESGPVSTTLTGFATPLSGELGGRALFSAQEGDANRNGDQALFGPTSATATVLSGPNNIATNFFASQINNDTGVLDTAGTFASSNPTNGSPGINIVGGRQGWDITNVDISSKLVNNQSSAVLTLTTSGDAYAVNANGIQVDINAPKINVVKSANVTGAITGDTIMYSVTVSNTGSANADSIVLSDALPSGSTLVTGSVTVAGVSKPTYDIVAGAPLGSLNLNSSVIVTYRVTITSYPATAQLVNTAKAAFSFQSVAGGTVITGVIPSNAVTIPVYAPNVTITKSANRNNATVGNSLLYTLLVTNSGNIGATITLTDNIPAGSSFITGTFKVNGIVISGANPVNGVAIGTVTAGGTATITFQTQINSLPSPPQLVDQATTTYTFQPPDARTISGKASSNTLTIPVTLPNISIVKTSSAPVAAVGDTLTYTSVIANNGTEPISNVMLTDILPTGATLVAGSVTVAGVAVPTGIPNSGISIGIIVAGGTATITFQALISTLPTTGQILNQSSVSYTSGVYSGNLLSNITTTLVYQTVIGLVKSANTSSVTVGDTITYNVAVQNTGNIAAQVSLTDPLPQGTSFVSNSVTVAGTSLPGQSPITGIAVGSVTAGATVNVTFQFILNTLPTPATVVNQAVSNYTYLLSTGRHINGTSNSNTLSIPASLPSVTVIKAVNVTEATINDVLTYTLIVKNNGISTVSNVIVSDVIASSVRFVTGSVTLNGNILVNAVPSNGINIGSLSPQASVTLSFQVKIISLPDSSTLSNRASVAFSSGAFAGSALSNIVTTPVYQALIGVIKSSSTPQATLGDTFTYMFQISNTGNTTANINFTDQVPAGCTFVTNSVLVAGLPTPGVSPSTGISIPSLGAGSSISVSYVVTITSYPLSKQLVNQATATYTYNLPSARQVTATSSSNTVVIPVAIPSVNIVKSSVQSSVVTGDLLTYAFVVTNSGITAINNVIVHDALASNTAFISGSVIVNGASKPGANPSDGILIGTLAPGTAATLTFEVRITMPIPSQITNQSTASFTSGIFSGSASSNIITTPVVQPQISIVKSANTTNATIGDAIIYTLTVSNAGNLTATATLTDLIPQGTTFTANSVIVNGFPQPGVSPATGINLGSISPAGVVIVTFGVVATILPSPQLYSNQGTVNYSYIPPDGRTLTGTAVSNTVSFPVSAPNVIVTKSTVSSAATVGDTLIYAIAITNSGFEAVSSVQFSDPPPPGTSFVPGSVTINGVTAPTVNPTAGFSIGSIAPGITTSVVFNVIVNSVPTPAELDNRATITFTSGAFSGSTYSNTVITPVYQPVVTVSKSASTANATVGDTVSYTFTINNSGNYGALVKLTDNIPSGTSFVSNSVLVNGVLLPGADPTTGINVGVIGAGQTTTVVLSVLINTLPSPQQLVNQGTTSSAFTLPDGRTLTRTATSNTVTIPVSAPNVAVVKSTTSANVTAGDVVTYVTAIMNNGIAAVNNVLFTDTIPLGTALVPGSVSVNGTVRPTANPSTGIILGSIAPSDTVSIAFNVIVNSLPVSATLSNQSSVSFTSGVFSGVTFSNNVTTPVYQPIFTALKSANTTNATVGDTVVYTININNSGNFGAQVVLTDSIPAGTTFSPNSVIVNGQSVAGADPSTGIPLGIITTNTVILFSVIVNEVPTGQQLVNQASATYTFALPDGRIVNSSFTSNTVTIPVSSPNVTVLKTTTFPDASFGDIVPYTVTVTNNGIENISNVVFTDSIPLSTSFIPGSVTVNGVPKSAANPAAGISLGTIAPGATDTVVFSVKIVSIPSSGQLANQSAVSFTSGVFSGSAVSNTNIIPIYQAIITAAKSASTSNATVGDTVNYSVALTNIGNLPAQGTLTDPIPAGAIFVPNSILVNGVPQPGADPTTGISTGTIAPGATVNITITLEVTIDTLPPQQQLVNQAFINYIFMHPDGRILNGSASSNILTIPVSSPNLSVVKSTTAIDAVVGDIITYSIVVTNNGIEAVNNVVLVDPVPTGTTFIVGSVTVDGVPKANANPSTGIPIGTIAPAVSSVVSFRVTVVTI